MTSILISVLGINVVNIRACYQHSAGECCDGLLDPVGKEPNCSLDSAVLSRDCWQAF